MSVATAVNYLMFSQPDFKVLEARAHRTPKTSHLALVFFLIPEVGHILAPPGLLLLPLSSSSITDSMSLQNYLKHLCFLPFFKQ